MAMGSHAGALTIVRGVLGLRQLEYQWLVMGPILHPTLAGHPTLRAGTICPSLTSTGQLKAHTLLAPKQ